MAAMSSSYASVLDRAPVLPVVVVDDPADAVPLARALVAGGLPAIEVTLRTPGALDAVAARDWARVERPAGEAAGLGGRRSAQV
jgi:2-keto-3-deoxy-6-phosphogluconate aldolase